jgi:8-oxo-dGTP pyrophosphatase MutT (NUDIX family)
VVKQTSSAGGILVRKRTPSIELVIVERTHNVDTKWQPVLRQLPKGAMEHGESLEETALREVKEETGYEARILKKVGIAQWQYKRNSINWKEIVHYYLMVPKTDQQHDHDNEFDHVRWVTIESAIVLLSYPEERELLKRVNIDERFISQL